MTTSLRACGLLAIGGVLVLLACGCDSSSASAGGFGGPVGWGGAGGSAGFSGAGAQGGAAGSGGGWADSAPPRSPLCGVGACDPGNSSACGAIPPIDDGGTPHPGDAAADADAGGRPRDAGADGGSAVSDARADGRHDAADDGGAPDLDGAAQDAAFLWAPADPSPDEAPAPSASDANAIADQASDEEEPARGCYIEIDQSAANALVSKCEIAGAAGEGGACDDSRECAPGLGCIDAGTKGICRQLFCTLPVACPASTYYQELPLRMAGAVSAHKVPVCMPADGCSLLDTNSCSGANVCTIVGDNATTCQLPGTAGRGEACSDVERCAEGLVCSKLTMKCLKLCRTGGSDCPGGACQGGSASFPEGIGVCVGDTGDAA